VPGEPRPAASLSELDWLAGAWTGEGLGGPAEEVYSPPAGGAIVGHFRQQRGEGVWFYELMVVQPDGDSLKYCLRHFNADLTAWEDKHEVQCFALIGRDTNVWYFDGLTIRREGEDGMVSAVRVKSAAESKEYVFRYRRRSR
jgi:hypothetical protein